MFGMEPAPYGEKAEQGKPLVAARVLPVPPGTGGTEQYPVIYSEWPDGTKLDVPTGMYLCKPDETCLKVSTLTPPRRLLCPQHPLSQRLAW